MMHDATMKHDHITHRIYIKPETPARDPHMRTTATSGHVGARCQEQDAGVRPTARPRTPRHRGTVVGAPPSAVAPSSASRIRVGRHPHPGPSSDATQEQGDTIERSLSASLVGLRSGVRGALPAHADTDGMEASYLVKTQVHKQAPTNTLQCLLACCFGHIKMTQTAAKPRKIRSGGIFPRNFTDVASSRSSA